MILCLVNAICGLDFNPLGTLTASFDQYGVCLISDIDTNDSSFHFKVGTQPSNVSNYFLSLYGNLFHFLLQTNNICDFTVII